MNNEQLKELIKLKTEFLKFYFISIIALLTGVVTLAMKDVRTPFQNSLLILGTALATVVVALILIISSDIRRLIDDLKSTTP